MRVEDGVVRATTDGLSFVEKPTPAQQKEVPVEADMVLVTVGRCPATEGLGLAEAGIGTDRRGWVVVDDALKTSLPEVYAIGDLLGPSRVMLAHVAAMEGLCVVESLCGKPRAMRYDAVPSGVFTSPEVGSVGLSEQQAREQGLDVRCVTFQMRGRLRAQAMGRTAGLLQAGGRCGWRPSAWGAHRGRPHASTWWRSRLGVASSLTLEQVAHTIHAHPTLAEGLYEAALLAQEASGRPMHWLLLLLAIGSEIVATSALKETQGFTRLLPSLLCIGGYALAFYLLSVVVKYVPVGIAYALWSGIGVVIVSLVGWFFFHQKLDLPAAVDFRPHRCRKIHSFFQKHGTVTKRAAETSCRPFFSGRCPGSGPRQTGRHPSAVPAFPAAGRHERGLLRKAFLLGRQQANLPQPGFHLLAGAIHPAAAYGQPLRLSSRKGRGGASRARCGPGLRA